MLDEGLDRESFRRAEGLEALLERRAAVAVDDDRGDVHGGAFLRGEGEGVGPPHLAVAEIGATGV